MKCYSPYRKIDRMGHAKEYPCGRCLNCRINRAEEWSTRICLELEDRRKQGDFITLTFDETKSCPLLSQALSKRVLQNFFKRVRKAGNRIKYFACGEYGEKHQRAHYHAVIIRGEDKPNYEKHWPYGNVFCGTVTKASARYVTGYLTKGTQIPTGRSNWPPFQLQSQGMGLEWAKQNKYEILQELSWVPRYFKNKTNLQTPPTTIPTRFFTEDLTLKQRELNSLGKRNCQKP